MTNTTDNDDAIDCLNRCHEKLELSGMDYIDNGMVRAQSATHRLIFVQFINKDYGNQYGLRYSYFCSVC